MIVHWGVFDIMEWDGNPEATEPVEKLRPACNLKYKNYIPMVSAKDEVTCGNCLRILKSLKKGFENGMETSSIGTPGHGEGS